MLKKIEHVHVACAILFRENHLFAAKRGANQRLSGYWEFPGGKIKYQESPSACVVRELKEELDMDVLPEECLDVVVHQYEDLKVSLYPIRCTLQSNAYKLKEHSEAGFRGNRLPNYHGLLLTFSSLRNYLMAWRI